MQFKYTGQFFVSVGVEPTTHDLDDFMSSVTEDMAREYDRIRKRATEDAGTAGDDGEETWAELLREWLPPIYRIVTKGRLLSRRNVPSPQVDVLVLHPTYPEGLLNKKYYLADLVVAAFECKLTLKADHIRKAVRNAAEIRRLLPKRVGSPYKELYSPIIYGLLAHSHVWKRPNSTPSENIHKHLFEADRNFTEHPREMLDVICVPDLATWRVTKTPQLNPEPMAELFAPLGSTTTVYLCCSSKAGPIAQPVAFTPIGMMFSHLFRRLAWEDPSIRKLAQYFSHVQGQGGGFSEFDKAKIWESDIYSDEIRTDVMAGRPFAPKIDSWNEWQILPDL
ncbi:MAG: hypothetical protein H8E47_10315 [Anaerolineales bacterium]|nr:hypothetical protein [Anaerolineales bacterium]